MTNARLKYSLRGNSSVIPIAPWIWIASDGLAELAALRGEDPRRLYTGSEKEVHVIVCHGMRELSRSAAGWPPKKAPLPQRKHSPSAVPDIVCTNHSQFRDRAG